MSLPPAAGGGSDHRYFQEILDLACRRVDALRSTHAEFDRRALPRKKIALRAQCAGGWGASPCLVSDFSNGGLALVCGHPHRIGDVIRLSWRSGPLDIPIEIECVVRHVTGANVGAQFLGLSPGQHERVVASLVEAPFADASSSARNTWVPAA